MKKILSVILALSLVICFASCGKKTADNDTKQNIDGIKIALSDSEITIDGVKATSNESEAVYTANDIVFYEEGHDFTYGEGGENDAHSKEEADAHTVVHITKAGTYVLSGTLSKGQIAVDLGEDAKKDPNAVVTLVLNGVNITSTVAPGIIFYNVYECGSDDTENADKTVDTTKAGANISIADSTENTLNGSYVAKIYKSVVLSDDGKEITESKKLHKYDGSIYSNMSLNINGDTGILNVNAENEGIESALHLTVNGGIINVVSGDDGLNSNEDNVSVTTINGGTLNIKIREGAAEGDGIDSNGYIVINGGNIIAQACSTSGDSGIDSDNGIYINGGTVIATGNMLDRIAGGAQNYAVFTFRESQKDSKTYEIQNNSGETVIKFTSENSFTYLVVSSPELKGGDYSLLANGTVLSVSESEAGGMQGGFGGERPNGDEGGQRPEDMSRPDGSNGTTPPEVPNGERPQMPGNQENNPPEMPSGEASEMPNGETPEKPSGEAPTDNGNTQTGKTVFNLNAGGNNYTVY
ncbi:MAG: carbohydrate-binding domain-containing protein [Oscillospiraceae bacterium]|nr:carbohydrate-binding domain-containing protein [Oscillospiraceae bacterium]